MARRLLALLIAGGLFSGIWLRSEPPPASRVEELTLTPLLLDQGCCQAGPLRLAGAWEMASPHEFFGGYSALIQTKPGQLLALSDRGYFADFSAPGALQRPPRFGSIQDSSVLLKANRDVEAATWDAARGRLWIAQEGRNAVERHRLDMARESFRPIPEMKDWPHNSGPESLLRLQDGRFVALCECKTEWFGEAAHPGLLFSGDPSEPGEAQDFTLAGIEGYRPTDMAQLPDGRILILVRRLVWPLPPRFANKVLIADPAALRAGGIWQARELAALDAPWPIDNFEGLAIERQADGKLIGWIISDENGSVTQRVLLLKLEIDERSL